MSTQLEVVKQAQNSATAAEMHEQFALATLVCESVDRANQTVIAIRDLKAELASRVVGDAVSAETRRRAEVLETRLHTVESALYQVQNQSPKDKIAFPIRLNDRLAGLLAHIQVGDGRPTRAHYQVFEELREELDAELRTLDEVKTDHFQPLNEAFVDEGLQPLRWRKVSSPPREASCGGPPSTKRDPT